MNLYIQTADRLIHAAHWYDMRQAFTQCLTLLNWQSPAWECGVLRRPITCLGCLAHAT